MYDLKSAILGNAGTTVAYRVGGEDGRQLSLHLGLDEYFRDAQFKGHEQLTTLPNHQVWLKTLRDGTPVLHHLVPYPAIAPLNKNPEGVIANSRNMFGRDRDKIEAGISAFYRRRFRG